LTVHPHPLIRTPALTSAPNISQNGEHIVTTVTDLDPWAITDPDEAQALPSNGEVAHHRRSHDREPEHDSVSGIDELAVLQVAHDGLRLRLRGAERDEAIRRMHGRIELDLIAWRLHTTTRTVHRVAARLGLTEHNAARTARRELVTTLAP